MEKFYTCIFMKLRTFEGSVILNAVTGCEGVLEPPSLMFAALSSHVKPPGAF